METQEEEENRREIIIDPGTDDEHLEEKEADVFDVFDVGFQRFEQMVLNLNSNQNAHQISHSFRQEN